MEQFLWMAQEKWAKGSFAMGSYLTLFILKIKDYQANGLSCHLFILVLTTAWHDSADEVFPITVFACWIYHCWICSRFEGVKENTLKIKLATINELNLFRFAGAFCDQPQLQIASFCEFAALANLIPRLFCCSGKKNLEIWPHKKGGFQYIFLKCKIEDQTWICIHDTRLENSKGFLCIALVSEMQVFVHDQSAPRSSLPFGI